MALSRNAILVVCFVVLAVSWAENNDDHLIDGKRPYEKMHDHYDGLGEGTVKDGFVSYDEIKRALGATTEEEWKKEIEPHDDGDKLLNAAEFENWLSSFRKQEL